MPNGFGKPQTSHKLNSLATKHTHLQNLFKLATQAYFTPEKLKAKQYCQDILAQNPKHSEALFLLGNIELEQGNLTAAIAAYQKLVKLQPQNVSALSNLGVLYIKRKDPSSAISVFQQAIQLDPNHGEAYINLGQLHQELGKSEAGKEYLLQGVKLQPNSAIAYLNLGNIEKSQGNLAIAIDYYLQAIKLDSKLSSVYNNLGNIYLDRGESLLACEYYHQAAKYGSDDGKEAHNLLFSLHYEGNLSALEIFTQHQNWGIKSQPIIKQNYKPHNNSLEPQRKLKIGYISGDFKTHSVNYFFEPLLANHNQKNFDITCYANNKFFDETSDRLRNLASCWRNIAQLDDFAVAQLIREDQIDILVDLAGHSLGNRLLVMAHKPAPVQATYLGYPNTTGLSNIDYRLTDIQADPIGQTAHLYTEQLVHLSQGFLCYQPPIDAPTVNILPVSQNKYITFASFNALSKVNQAMINCWTNILKKVPNSRLLLKAKALQDQDTRDRIYQLFKHVGIDRDRLDLRGWVKHTKGHLGSYNDVDIALDTYPYHGTTTSCEALWMGVPMITLAGDSHVSRVGVSLLNSVGLTEFVSDSVETYVQKAVELANNLDKLAEVRQGLRSRMSRSPLTDGKRLAQEVETAYRQMWEKWCQSKSVTRVKTTGGRKLTIKSLPIKSLNSQPKNSLASNPTISKSSSTKFKIHTLHHLSASGGTLISKCLASMPNVVLLSEINPRVTTQGFNPFDPIQQLTKYNLLTPSERQDIFLDRIALISRKCQQNQQALIIRDHTHSDFLLNHLSTQNNLRSTLETQYDLQPVLTLRNPIDSWLAMIPQGWHKQVKTFDCYCDRYLQLLNTYQDCPYYLYEDFVEQPDLILQQICNDYGITFDLSYQQKFSKIKLSGDSGRSSGEIITRPRRKYSQSFVKEVNQSANFQKICQRLGYLGFE